METGSEKSKVDDGSEKVEVEVVDFGEVAELRPESVTKQHEEYVAVEETLAEEKNVVEKSGSSEASIEEKEVEKFSAVSEPEAPVKEVVTEAKTLEEAALPISDTNVVESSGVDYSVSKENVVHSSEPIPLPPSDAANGGGDRDVSENPSSTENQVLNLGLLFLCVTRDTGFTSFNNIV